MCGSEHFGKYYPVVFDLEYAIRSVQVHQDGLKLNGTNHLLDYDGDVKMLGGSVHTIKKTQKLY